MKKITLIVLVVMVAGLAFAFGGDMHGNGKMGRGHGGKMNHDGMMMGRMMDELELNDAQKEKIETLNFEHKKVIISKRADLKTLELEKGHVMQKEEFGKARKLNDKIFNLKKEIANFRLTLHENIFNQLTPEQQEKAKELRKMHAGRRMRKHCDDGGKENEHRRRMQRDWE